MPRNNNNYSQKQFEDDLQELEQMINSQGGLGHKSKKNLNNYLGGYDNNNDDNNDNNDNDDNDDNNNDDNDDYENDYYHNGGKEKYTGVYRHFRVVEVDGKEVKFGIANITSKQTPLNAAKKLLKSIALYKNLKGLNKLKLGSVKYCIQETTRGSKTHGKIYGPYVGKYQKYSPEEMKKAMASGQKFTMKPVVSKASSNQKGGHKL